MADPVGPFSPDRVPVQVRAEPAVGLVALRAVVVGLARSRVQSAPCFVPAEWLVQQVARARPESPGSLAVPVWLVQPALAAPLEFGLA